MTNNRIRALTFDVFGTVVDWRSSIAVELERFFGPRDVQRDWYRFATDWRDRYQPAMEEIRTGRRPFVILDVLHRENLEQVLDRYAIDGLSPNEVDRLNNAWHRLDPWPDSVEGLYALRKHYTVATLSNGNVSLMVDLARHGSLPWDAILGAEFARAYKPDPRAYLGTAAALGCAPEACLMVAAHNSDLHAARDLGFRTAYVNRPTEHGPSQTSDLGPESDWDHACESLPELARLLADERGRN